jgi:hypothetical protein
MPIKLLQREISKPIESQGPRSTGGFYNPRRIVLTYEEKRYLQALWNFLPEKKITEVQPDPELASKEREG